MGVVFKFGSVKFKVNAKDHNPPHVHVEGKGTSVRINLESLDFMDEGTDFSKGDLHEILTEVIKNQELLLKQWRKYHGAQNRKKRAAEIISRSKIKTGKVDLLSPDEFKSGKFRLNMWIDIDVVDAIRKQAKAEHMPYQTFINRKLREVALTPKRNELSVNSFTELRSEMKKIVEETIIERVEPKALKEA